MGTIDLTIVLAYLAGVTALSVWAGRRQTSTRSYFLGEQSLPWWMVMLSIVGTETSVLTFLSVPGLAFSSDLGFLQLAVGYVLGRVIVARLFLPGYFREGIESAYEFIGHRWGMGVRRLSSAVFMVTRLLADGVRLFMTAIPLRLITGWSMPVSIAVMGALTLLYAYVGGITSVVWAEAMQFGIYILGAGAAMAVVGTLVDGGWGTILGEAAAAGKTALLHGFDGSFDAIATEPYHFLTAVAGGCLLTLASHGTDHLLVQRLLACRNLRSAQKALIGSGLVVLVQFALFLVLGLGLWKVYGGRPIGKDEIFPDFIIHNLPTGVAGLVVAAVFAAAMSTSVNALASTIVTDWMRPTRPDWNTVGVSRAITLLWGIALIGGSIGIAIAIEGTDHPLVEVGLSISSFTYGGLLGFFLLGRLDSRPAAAAVTGGFLSSMVAMAFIVTKTDVAWPWYTGIGLAVMFGSAWAVHRAIALFRRRP